MQLHCFCRQCYLTLYPRMIPAQPAKGIPIPCCGCGEMTDSGIRDRDIKGKCRRTGHPKYNYEEVNPLPTHQPIPRYIISNDEIAEVIRLAADRLPRKEIARQTGFKLHTINRILRPRGINRSGRGADTGSRIAIH